MLLMPSALFGMSRRPVGLKTESPLLSRSLDDSLPGWWFLVSGGFLLTFLNQVQKREFFFFFFCKTCFSFAVTKTTIVSFWERRFMPVDLSFSPIFGKASSNEVCHSSHLSIFGAVIDIFLRAIAPGEQKMLFLSD